MPCVMMRLACFRHVACSAFLIMHAYFTSLAPAQRLGRCDRRVQGASVSIQGSAPDSGSQLCQLWRSLEPELRSRSFTHSSSTVRCTCRRGSRTSGAGICSVGRSWLTSSAGNLHADIRGSSSKPAAGSRVPIRQARVRRSHRQVFMLAHPVAHRDSDAAAAESLQWKGPGPWGRPAGHKLHMHDDWSHGHWQPVPAGTITAATA